MSDYQTLTDEQAAKFDKFCERIEEGDSLKEALKASGIAWGQVCRWADRDKAVEARYARARSSSADFWASKATEAAEDAKEKDDAPVARLKYDARRWRASVADPKRYSDKVDVTTGGEKLQPSQTIIIGGRSIAF